jgi:HAD superfamily hydrolase (TIGR01458 family)
MRLDGLLVDLDGVLAVGWEPVPGAIEALDAVRDRGVPLRIVTNTTSDTRRGVAGRLAELGFAVTADDVMSAPAATGAYLREHHPGARCFLVNHGDVTEDLEGVELVEDGPVDVVLFGGAGMEFTYERLNHAFTHLRDGAAFVAMHRELSWKTADGWALDTGAYVTGLEHAAGVEATVVGKPEAAFFLQAVGDLGVDPARVAMVGDDIVNDVLAAQACGLHGVLVRTGKFRQETLDAADGEPEAIIDSFAHVPGLLR